MRDEDVRLLAEWRGAGAVLWSYSASHAILEVRLHRSGVAGNAHLVLGGCERLLIAITSWPNSKFEIQDDASTGKVRVIDEAVGFDVYCTDVRVRTNVPPVY